MKNLNLSTKILLGLSLGIGVGLGMQGIPEIATTYIGPFGTLFLNLIKMIIVPLVFSSLVVGACGLGDVKKMGRIGGRTIIYYMGTTAFAVSLGLVIANVMHLGAGFQLPGGLAEATAAEAPGLVATILNIVPTNPLKALVEGNMLQIIVFALFVGGGIMMVGEKAQILYNFFNGFAEVMYKITNGVMSFAPYAIFALICPVVAVNGAAVLLPLASVIIAVYLGCALHAILVYSATVRIFAKMSPLTFFKGMVKPMVFAFTTASSAATLPLNMQATKELGAPLPIRSFCLPLGATINMDGTALYQGICALFIAAVYGIDLSIGQQVTVVLTATLASIGTAGVPGAGMIMLSMVLQSVGLPLEGIALIAGIDRILDMARTCVNITGDAACTIVIAASEGELAPLGTDPDAIK